MEKCDRCLILFLFASVCQEYLSLELVAANDLFRIGITALQCVSGMAETGPKSSPSRFLLL